MAKNITIQVSGGTPKVIEASTVRDAYNALGLSGTYNMTVNGDPVTLDTELNDYEFVFFATAIKGN